MRRIRVAVAGGTLCVLLGTACNYDPQRAPVSTGVGTPTQEVPAVSVESSDSAPASYQAQQAGDPLVKPLIVPGFVPAWKPSDPYTIDQFVSLADEFAHDPSAAFHAHGEKVCASGCATSNHPTAKLTHEHFLELLDQYANEPMSEDSAALEQLLYFGRQTRVFIEAEGFGPLDALRSRFLWDELSRTHARVSIRLVDEHGKIRSWLDSTQVPFDRRHVFDMQTNDLQPLVTSGTVKRVGLDHLWTRL